MTDCARIISTFVVVMVMGTSLSFAQEPFPQVAQKLTLQHGPLTTIVTEMLAQARTFQIPSRALDSWGDPSESRGIATPTLSFRWYSIELNRSLDVRLFYDPPAAHPKRLAWIEISGLAK